MCGIAGFFKTKKETYSKEKDSKIHQILTDIFEETQSRGSDASGFSYINNYGELKTVKGPVASSDMIKEAKWLKLADELPMSLIAHCRAWTKGEPLNNFNNHPIVLNKEIALIHNGCISNDEDIKGECVLKPKGEVDSEALPLRIHTELYNQLGEDQESLDPSHIVKAINETAKDVYGGYACAMLHRRTPEFLYLFDHSNPIVLAYVPELDVVFFASTEQIMKEGFKKHFDQKETKSTLFRFFSFKEAEKPKYSIDRVADNTIIVIGFLSKLGDDGQISENFDISFWDMDANFSRVKTTPQYNARSVGQGTLVGVDGKDLVLSETGVSEAFNPEGLREYNMPKRKVQTTYSYNTNGYAGFVEEEEDWRGYHHGY